MYINSNAQLIFRGYMPITYFFSALSIFFLMPHSQAMSCGDLMSTSEKKDEQEILLSIPVGEMHALNLQEWFQNLTLATQNLKKSIHLNEWIIPAKDGILGNLIENPTTLEGDIIAGILQKSTGPHLSTTLFAGKVLSIYNSSKENGIPFYHAILDTQSGRQKVEITGAFSIHVLKTKIPHKPMGIPEVDILPLRKIKSYTHENWVKSIKESKNELIRSLNPLQWKSTEQETPWLGTNILAPEKLKGKMICGILAIEDSKESSVTIFAGKVLELHPIVSHGSSPFYRIKIDGPLGILETNLIDLHAVHILK